MFGSPECCIKSAKLTAYLLNKFNITKSENNQDIVLLSLFASVKSFKLNMFSRSFTSKEVATMILNENDPKTMDYFFMKLLDVQLDNTQINYSGTLTGTVRSAKSRITEAFGVLRRIRNFARGQIYFVMDIHEHQIFPKSRSFRICSRRLMPGKVINPNAGQKKQITYGSGYVSTYLEPNEILIPKHLVLYCRNAWERKGEVKPSRANQAKPVVNVAATA
jgi:hypothetical protein